MACFRVGVFQGDGVRKAQKYIAVFNSQSNWLPLWKINFSNELVFW
jgi:hypothetical protein